MKKYSLLLCLFVCTFSLLDIKLLKKQTMMLFLFVTILTITLSYKSYQIFFSPFPF